MFAPAEAPPGRKASTVITLSAPEMVGGVWSWMNIRWVARVVALASPLTK